MSPRQLRFFGLQVAKNANQTDLGKKKKVVPYNRTESRRIIRLRQVLVQGSNAVPEIQCSSLHFSAPDLQCGIHSVASPGHEVTASSSQDSVLLASNAVGDRKIPVPCFQSRSHSPWIGQCGEWIDLRSHLGEGWRQNLPEAQGLKGRGEVTSQKEKEEWILFAKMPMCPRGSSPYTVSSNLEDRSLGFHPVLSPG